MPPENSCAIAAKPEPPYYAVIFTSLRTEGDNGYEAMAQAMAESAARQDGYLGVKSARDGIGITVSYWRDLAAIAAWKQAVDHLVAQKLGRELWYSAPIESASRGLSAAMTSYRRMARSARRAERGTMSKPIVITVPHNLGREKAHRLIAAEIERLRSAYIDKFAQSDVQWTGDTASVRVVALAQEVKGQLDISDDSVRIEVELPWIFAALTGRIENALTTTAQETLRLEDKTKKP
jgi:heme-degrading monooxygenase HmoA